MEIRNPNRDGENEPCVFFKHFKDYHKSMPRFLIVSMFRFHCLKNDIRVFHQPQSSGGVLPYMDCTGMFRWTDSVWFLSSRSLTGYR